jgi:hypothetical protein
MPTKRLTIKERKDIFRSLVSTQDTGLISVPESVQQVSKQFEITETQLRQIQEEGIEKEWPPLNDPVPSLN